MLKVNKINNIRFKGVTMTIKADIEQNCALIARKILNSKTIIILSHIAPDGDALGSILALQETCKQLDNIEIIDAVILGKVPDIYKFLPGISNLKNHDDASLLDHYDLTIAVDSASQDRLGKAEKFLNVSHNTINIDHHGSNTNYTELNLIDDKASATGEIIFELANTLNADITKTIATNLYVSILTDTGGFKFSNTTSKSLIVAAKLIDYGADPQNIYQECYENKPFEMMKLHAFCVSNIEFSEDKKIAWSRVTRKLLKDLNAFDDHIDGIVELIRQIDSVEIALLFKETRDGNIKVSFRSKEIDICPIALELGGGGHKCAAGATIKGITLEESINCVLPKIKNLLE